MSDLKSCVEPILTLSTGHLGECLVTYSIAAGEEECFMDKHSSMKGDHGWLMWTGGDNEPMFLQTAYKGVENTEALNALSDILKAAREQGCSFVMFDGDGELVEQFPVFEW